MAIFDITKLTPDVRKEIAACKNAEELKAYFASKNMIVPDSKLEAILTFCGKSGALDPEDLAMVSGAGCCLEESPPKRKEPQDMD